MPTDIHDLRSTILPKSDQLNADQLLAGPLVITVKDVRVGAAADQPVSIFHDTDPARPFKPCLTMRKVLILAWGPDGTQWVGRSMELYCDQSVKWAGEEVGGIRISRLTDIAKGIKVSLAATKGKKALHEIGVLKLSDALHEVLEAIGAAEGKSGLDKAKAKAKELRSTADQELALSAYKKRVEALREQAATKKAPTIDPADDPSAGTTVLSYAALADRINRAPDRDVADLVLADMAHLPADQQDGLRKLADETFPGEGA